MRITRVVLALLWQATTAYAGCEDSKAFFINESPVPQKPNLTVDLQVPQSAEGGEFYVYLGSNKKPQRIFRFDYGETFRVITKLSLATPKDIFIARTKQIYDRPFTLPGSRTVREETDFYEYCEDKTASGERATQKMEDAKATQAIIDEAFSVPEIQPALKAAGFKNLTSR